jgi:predicted transcriptional regulator
MSRDIGVENGEGRNSKMSFVMEWIWRVLTVVLLPMMVYLLVQLSAIQATQVDTRARLFALEQKTAILPPGDYRAFLDAKFESLKNRMEARAEEVDKQLDEIKADLRIHMRPKP